VQSKNYNKRKGTSVSSERRGQSSSGSLVGNHMGEASNHSRKLAKREVTKKKALVQFRDRRGKGGHENKKT